jgi:hypothetical protein
MINENFVYVGLFLSIIGGFSYLIDTLKGKIQPNKVSFFLWALAPLIAFFAMLQEGVDFRLTLLTFIVGFNPLLIFLASFVNKKAQWKITRFDLVCGGLSLFGIFLWLITRTGNVAIFFSILADGLASIPIIVKAYKYPETENYWPFAAGCINALLTLLIIKEWIFANYGFTLYIFFVTFLLAILIKFKLGKAK